MQATQVEASQTMLGNMTALAQHNLESQQALMNTVVQSSNQQISAMQGLTVAVASMNLGPQGPNPQQWTLEGVEPQEALPNNQ